MRYYAVIDTNVLVSAMLKWDSIPGNVMEFVYGGIIVPLWNRPIVAEYRSVLSREKFHLTKGIVDSAVGEMEKCGIFIAPKEEQDAAFPDPKDRVFYEVVMEKRKSDEAFLVTGNIRHFPKKPFVVTPRQMIKIIQEDIEKNGPIPPKM